MFLERSFSSELLTDCIYKWQTATLQYIYSIYQIYSVFKSIEWCLKVFPGEFDPGGSEARVRQRLCRDCRRTEQQQSSPDTLMILCQIQRDTQGWCWTLHCVWQWSCSQSSSLCSTDSHLHFIPLSVTAGWSSPLHLPVTWPSQSVSTHKLLLLQPLWIIRTQLLLSQHTHRPVYHHHLHLQREEGRAEEINECFQRLFISCQSVMQHIQYKEQQGLQCWDCTRTHCCFTFSNLWIFIEVDENVFPS